VRDEKKMRRRLWRRGDMWLSWVSKRVEQVEQEL
jgi:hypothetical protein